jgi:putative selenate reductase molybdopterin-binding subunit
MIQQCFLDHGAVQCGYCTPAMLLVGHALLEQNRDADEDAIRDALASVLCRCTGYVKPIEALTTTLAAAARTTAKNADRDARRSVTTRSSTPRGG